MEKGQCQYQLKLSRLPETTKAFQQWAKETSAGIMANSCSPHSADIIVLLEDEVGFDLIGDHGGAQEKVQRIPMIYKPRQKAQKVVKPMNLSGLHREMFGN